MDLTEAAVSCLSKRQEDGGDLNATATVKHWVESTYSGRRYSLLHSSLFWRSGFMYFSQFTGSYAVHDDVISGLAAISYIGKIGLRAQKCTCLSNNVVGVGRHPEWWYWADKRSKVLIKGQFGVQTNFTLRVFTWASSPGHTGFHYPCLSSRITLSPNRAKAVNLPEKSMGLLEIVSIPFRSLSVLIAPGMSVLINKRDYDSRCTLREHRLGANPCKFLSSP